MKINKLILIPLFLAANIALAQDPNDTNNYCVGCPWPTNGSTGNVYGSNDLYLTIDNNRTINDYGANSNLYYSLQWTDDLSTNWTELTKYIGGLLNTNVPNDQPQRYYRGGQLTNYLVVWEEAINFVGSDICPGSFISQVRYYNNLPGRFGYVINTNTSPHTFSDGAGRTDVKISWAGAFGDSGCGTGSVTITNPLSPEYRFIIYFKTNSPASDYPAILRGFKL